MDAAQHVIRAATQRAAALAEADEERLGQLLHERFRWTAHTGESYDREEYVRRNTDGRTVWRSQELGEPDVVVVDGTGVLHAVVTDVIVREGSEVTFRMPVTQVWVREDDAWRCLAGHAGPRLD